MRKKTIVLNFGGSIIAPEVAKIDLKILKNLKKLIEELKKDFRIILVVGGGKTSRHYQQLAKKIGIEKSEALDWIGIRITHLNAEFIRSFLGQETMADIVLAEDQKCVWKKGILLSGGWRPGRSTDFVASRLALRHKAELIVVATNVAYLFDKDPNLYSGAKKIEKINWNQFEKIIPTANRWTPGMSAPLDPKAVKVCKKNKIRIIFLDGRKFKNILKAVKGESFAGTLVF